MRSPFVIAALGFLALSGCNPSGPAILQISGHYEGSLTTHFNGRFQRSSVRTDIAKLGSSDQASAPQYVVKDTTGATQLTLAFSSLSESALSVQSSLMTTQPVTLSLDSSDGCYTGKSDAPNGISVALCATTPVISFEIDDANGSSLLSLVLYSFSQPSGPGTQEKPQTFTLTTAIDRARSASFEAKIEFEHVIQAKGLANAAYLHLLPQLTLGTLANNLTPSFSTVLMDISDLAPFLLPSRWIRANEASDHSRAEQDADEIMKLDMGTEIEGLFYSYDRDRRSQGVYNAVFRKVDAIHATVQKLEAAGELPLGTTDNITAMQIQIQRAVDIFSQVLAEDRAAISQSLGFFNPLTVQDAVIDQEPFPIENAPAVDFQTVNDAAIARSFELDQMDWLVSAAQLAKTEEGFDWLDPVGDSNLGLGAALPAQIDVAQSKIDELQIDRDQVKAIISEKAFNAVTDYKQALDNYAIGIKSADLQNRRLNETLAQLNAGEKIDIATLLDILNDYIDNQIQIEEARADYRVARSEIDRLLLQGFYANF